MKKVVVLMSTYNGATFLKTQIDSVLNQRGVDVSLFVRDDGSFDSTLAILNEYAEKGKLTWYSGKNLKSAQSFFDLIFNAPDADYYAFCDQDDYWEDDKIIQAVKLLEKEDNNRPLLYCSATKLVDANLKPLNIKRRYLGVIDFPQSIISSNATGCTMCFNLSLFKFIRMHRPTGSLMHDAWIHKLCLAIGGIVIYDSNSYILYRQHGHNVVGGSSTFFKRWRRRVKNLIKVNKVRSAAIKEIYACYQTMISQENLKLCQIVCAYDESFGGRLRLLFNKKIRQNNKSVDFFFRISVLLGIF